MLVSGRLPCRAAAVHRAMSGVYFSPRPDGLRGYRESRPPRCWWSITALAFAAAGAAVAAAPALSRRSPYRAPCVRCRAASAGLLLAYSAPFIIVRAKDRRADEENGGTRERGNAGTAAAGGAVPVPAAPPGIPRPCGAVSPRLCGVGCLSGLRFARPYSPAARPARVGP